MILLLILSCEKKTYKNPLDPDSDKNAWAPTDLQIEQITDTQIKLSWKDNTDSEEGFKIDRKVGDAEWEIGYATEDADVLEWTDILPPVFTNTTAYYRVYAYANVYSSAAVSIDCQADCGGVWWGNNLMDNCSTCDSDPSNDCVQDCAGIWGGIVELDACGECGGNITTTSQCPTIFEYGCDNSSVSFFYSWSEYTDSCIQVDVSLENTGSTTITGIRLAFRVTGQNYTSDAFYFTKWDISLPPGGSMEMQEIKCPWDIDSPASSVTFCPTECTLNSMYYCE